MTCHRCGSTEHLIKQCPHPKGLGKGQNLAFPAFHERAAAAEQRAIVDETPGPLTALLGNTAPGDINSTTPMVPNPLLQSFADPSIFTGVSTCEVREHCDDNDAKGPLHHLIHSPCESVHEGAGDERFG